MSVPFQTKLKKIQSIDYYFQQNLNIKTGFQHKDVYDSSLLPIYSDGM